MREIQIIIDNEPATRGEFSINVEQIDVSSLLPEPDPHWTFVDAHGHFHAYTADLKLPTLDERADWVAYVEPDEETGETGYAEVHLYCRICDEEIWPGRRVDPSRKLAPGRKSWTVTVNTAAALGEKKSVRVISGDQMYFGVGVVGDIRDDHGQPAVEIFGVFELGSRRA